MQINYEFKTLSVFSRRTEDHIRKRSWLITSDCLRSSLSLSALCSLLNGFFSTLIKSAKFCNLASLNSKETRNFSSKPRRELLRALSYRRRRMKMKIMERKHSSCCYIVWQKSKLRETAIQQQYESLISLAESGEQRRWRRRRRCREGMLCVYKRCCKEVKRKFFLQGTLCWF